MSWLSFKTQCEQSEQILKNTFKCPENDQTIKTTNEQSTSHIPPQSVQSVDSENVVIIFEENESSEIKSSQHQSSEPFCDIESGTEKWNASTSKVKAEEYSMNYVQDGSVKDQLQHDNEYEVVEL